MSGRCKNMPLTSTTATSAGWTPTTIGRALKDVLPRKIMNLHTASGHPGAYATQCARYPPTPCPVLVVQNGIHAMNPSATQISWTRMTCLEMVAKPCVQHPRPQHHPHPTQRYRPQIHRQLRQRRAQHVRWVRWHNPSEQR